MKSGRYWTAVPSCRLQLLLLLTAAGFTSATILRCDVSDTLALHNLCIDWRLFSCMTPPAACCDGSVEQRRLLRLLTFCSCSLLPAIISSSLLFPQNNFLPSASARCCLFHLHASRSASSILLMPSAEEINSQPIIAC